MTEPAAVDDWGLLAEAPERRGAMATLFDRHRHYVYRLAWGFAGEQLADDVTQEVFLRLARNRRRLVPRARFTTWLYRVTWNVARELGRRGARELSRAEPAAEPRSSAATAVAAVDPVLTDLERALAALPARQREVVVLRYLEGRTTRETARVMGCREGTVKAHLHKALGALRRSFADPAPAASVPRVPDSTSKPKKRDLPFRSYRRQP